MDNIKKLVEQRDPSRIAAYMKEHGLKLQDGKIVCDDPTKTKAAIAYWDKRQLVKKINLNS